MISEKDEETTQMAGESIARTAQPIVEQLKHVATTAQPLVDRCSNGICEVAGRVHRKTQSICHRLHVLFTKHPKDNNMTYTRHALHALHLALRLGKGAVATCVHSIFPFLCEKTGTQTVDQLHEEIHQTKKRTLE